MTEQSYVEPQQQYTAPYNFQSLQTQATDALLRWQQEFNNIMVEMIHRFRGDEFDFIHQVWTSYEDRRIMNEIGINAVLLKIFEKVNQFNIMSNLTDKQCHELTFSVDMVVIPLLAMNYETYQLDVRYLPFVWETVDSVVFLGLRRAVDEGERIYLTKTTSRVEHYQEAAQPQKKAGGIMSMFGFGKGGQ